ncbi:Protein of unknown function [Pyronema omphalodes CBS 100304]|uniref:Uncharacterized protein n=1 Tax=Pyronema omphalodes (strain CBS 100304) TaxID=1076935 RepID=U4L7S2_PYROM|nr:Protein of unknown function [Pyronema omphalodes CBS 100304]
MNDNYNVDLGY